MVLTATGLPRTLHAEDIIILEGVIYTISKVKPSNRFRDSVYNCIIYPERADQIDPFGLHSVDVTIDGSSVSPLECIGEEVTLNVLYGGTPTDMSFNQEDWYPFTSYIRTTVTNPMTLYIKQESSILSYEILP